MEGDLKICFKRLNSSLPPSCGDWKQCQDEDLGELALEALKNQDLSAWRRYSEQLKDRCCNDGGWAPEVLVETPSVRDLMGVDSVVRLVGSGWGEGLVPTAMCVCIL